MVIVYELPFADFSFTNPCEDNAVYFNDLSSIGSGSIVSWNYAFGDTSAASTQQNPSHIYNYAGTYPVTLQIVSNNNCTNSVTYNISVLPSPIANFVMSANPVVALEAVTFTDQSYGGPVGWIWNFGDSTGTNVQNTNHSYSSGGSYTVSLVVMDVNGCVDTISHDITVALLPVLPTAFTPGNNDGHNDVFYVRGGPFRKLKFKVFNNWGELLFETEDQTQGWDGTYKGVEQPMGVYVWTVDVEITDSRTIRTSGDVTLIR
jgi:gliding motility-associated-like protein